ncbi:Ser-Thr histidine kinase [Salix suchowensis]|nr:Ser-Thr histidine kinase [Salix suchowensis]
MPVHEVRRDVPEVLASIVDKIAIGKKPRQSISKRIRAQGGPSRMPKKATRYSLNGFGRGFGRFYNADHTGEANPYNNHLSLTRCSQFGRDKELETIRNVSEDWPRTGLGTGVDSNESVSSSESPTQRPADGRPQTANLDGSAAHDSSLSTSLSPSLGPSDGSGLRRVGISTKHRVPRVQTVVIVGPPGQSSKVERYVEVYVPPIPSTQQPLIAHGLWGQAKFQSAESAPFAALLSCLSSVLRQLMVFHTDLHRFVSSLKERLGPQLQNIPLLYHGVPELHDLLAQYDISIETPNESLLTAELRARFQSLVENVFSVIAETRLFALFLDDLHEADDSDIVTKVKSMFQSRAKPTWIHLEPLNYSSVLSLVSKTLHREKDDCAPLATFVYSASSGNAFSARSILTTLQRQHRIEFDWEQNYWKYVGRLLSLMKLSRYSRYDMESIEASLADQKISDPADLTFLTSQFQELPEEAKKYLHWAAFFGETFVWLSCVSRVLLTEWQF